ncbi:MAG TPA: FtsX-like permease family protein [Steroidobacteraceae bacterium]|nr:FtsX-like permease family protein [Steroidobacteraceae bacterium]
MLPLFAWRNLWRRPQRTLLSLLSIALVVALLVCMLSFQRGVYQVMKENNLRVFDGYAQFQAPGYADDPTIDRVIDHPAGIVRAALAIKGIGAAAARVNGFGILANGERSYGALIAGVDPGSESQLSTIAATVRAGRYLNDTDRDAAVLGELLARNLQVSVGGTVSVLGAARDGSVGADVLQVVGIFRSGIPQLDRSILEMPLARAQDAFDMTDRANTIALGGPTLSGVDAALPRLAALGAHHGVALLDWKALEPAMRDAIALKYAMSLLLYLTLVAVVAFIILNALLMSVLERTHEFGVLLAIGMRARAIGLMVWLELLTLALTGCAAGFAAGAGATWWLEQRGISFGSLSALLAQYGLPPRLYPALDPVSALTGPVAILVAIVLGGIVPYARVTRLTALAAMRSE